MIRVTAVQPESIAEELGLAVGTELLAVNGRELEDFLDWEFLTAEEEFLLHVRQPDGEEIEFEIERPLGEPIGRRARAGPDPPLRQPLRLLLRGRPARRPARRALHPGRRLPALVPLRQLRHAHQPQAARRRADHRVPALAALRLGPRHRSHRAALPAPESHRARHPPAAPRLRRPRHRVPHPDRDVAGRERRRGAASRRCASSTSSAPRSSAARWCRSGSPSSASITSCASRPRRSAARPSAWSRRARRVARRERGIHWAFGADELYLRAGVELPPAEIYDGFDQVENGVGSVRWLQRRIDDGADELAGLGGPADRRGDRHRDGASSCRWCSSRWPGRPARSSS